MANISAKLWLQPTAITSRTLMTRKERTKKPVRRSQCLAVLVNNFQVVRNPSTGKNESVSNIVSRNNIPINTIFDSPPGFYESEDQRAYTEL